MSEEELSLEDLNLQEVDDDMTLDNNETQIEIEVEKPNISSPEWQEWLLSQFVEEELENNKYPKVSGLRRLVISHIGDIVESTSTVISCTVGLTAVVESKLKIVGPCGTYIVSDVAECNMENTDLPFRKFLVSTAATRAEGRALRKLLNFRNPAAEEMSTAAQGDIPTNSTDEFENQKITFVQMNTIDLICKRKNINIQKYVSSGSKQYDSINHVSYASALAILSALNKIQEPEIAIQGYDKNWRNNFSTQV